MMTIYIQKPVYSCRQIEELIQEKERYFSAFRKQQRYYSINRLIGVLNSLFVLVTWVYLYMICLPGHPWKYNIISFYNMMAFVLLLISITQLREERQKARPALVIRYDHLIECMKHIEGIYRAEEEIVDILKKAEGQFDAEQVIHTINDSSIAAYDDSACVIDFNPEIEQMTEECLREFDILKKEVRN